MYANTPINDKNTLFIQISMKFTLLTLANSFIFCLFI